VGEKKLKEMDLESVLNKSLEKYEYLSKEKGIRIKINLKSKCCVLADDLLENVFSNLIENAIIHSGCKNIEINVDEKEDEVIITIQDDGCGIPKEIADKIFEWGVKGKESKGSGLGLHLVKRIVEGYGGKILLKESQQGTVFEIHLRKC
jgi:signal transduction histidine kinase